MYLKVMYDYFSQSKSLLGVSVTNDIEASSSKLFLTQGTLDGLKSGEVKIEIIKHGNQNIIKGFVATIGITSGLLKIFLGCDDAEVVLGINTTGRYDLRLWRNSYVNIGEGTTSNGVMIVCANSSFVCGKDCMFSDGVIAQTADQHGIVDLKKGVIINNYHKKTILGEHVWVGRQSRLLTAISVGDKAIIGFGAVVSSDIDHFSVAVGVPARVVRRDVSWSRSPIILDMMAEKYVNSFYERVSDYKCIFSINV